MARDVEALILQMSANLRQYERSLDRMTAVSQKRLTAVEAQALKSQKNLERIMGRAGDGMVNSLKASLSAVAPTLAAAFSAQQVIQYADSYTSLGNRLKAAGLEGEKLRRTEDALYVTANRNGLQVNATAELYSKASLARRRLGASEADLLTLVSGTAAALKVQGTSAEAASGPLLQLGQAISGTKVQAEEYNSLIDGLPVLLQAAAKGSDRFGGDVAKLTELVKDGKVTSQEFFRALLAGFPAIEAQAANSTTTASSALQTLDNQLGRYVGQTDSSLGATQRMAQGIEGLANNLDQIVPVVGVLAGLVGGRYVLALTAATGAQIANGVSAVRLIAFQTAMTASMTGTTTAALTAAGATRTFNAAIAANPLGAALIAVTALSAGIIFLGDRLKITGTATQDVAQANKALETATEAYTEASNAAAIATGKEAVAAKAAAAEKRALAVAARDAAQAKLAEASATVALIEAEAQRQLDLERRAPIRGDRPGSVQTIGREERQRLADNQASAAASRAAITSANAAIAAADQALKRRAPAAPPDKPSKPAAAAATGPTPAELAAQREMLDLQGRVELLRAQGREEEAKAAQRQIDTLTLTKQYEDAGFQNAKAKAEAQVAALARADASAAFIAQFEQDQNRFIEERTQQFANQAALAVDELGLRAEIARLLGDEAGVLAAERELAIVQRTADLRSKGLGEPDAQQQATRETDQLRGAEIAGSLGSGFVDPAETQRALYAEIERLRQADVLSETQAAAAKAQANAAYEEQRLANAGTFFSTLAQLQNSSSKELAAIGKAAAIAQATMDGYVAVQKALASAPPPFNYALAAAVGVVAAANVAQIAGLKDGGPVGGSGGPREDNQLRWLSAGEYVVNAKATAKHRALLEAINSGGIPKLASGGPVGLPALPNLSGLGSRSSSQSIFFSPTIDARGADMAAAARIEQGMDQLRRDLPSLINGTRERRHRYRLGRNRDD